MPTVNAGPEAVSLAALALIDKVMGALILKGVISEAERTSIIQTAIHDLKTSGNAEAATVEAMFRGLYGPNLDLKR